MVKSIEPMTHPTEFSLSVHNTMLPANVNTITVNVPFLFISLVRDQRCTGLKPGVKT